MRLFNWFKSETTPQSIERSVRRTLYADPRLRDLDVPRIRIAANELTKQLREMLQADSRLKALAKHSVVFQGRAELRGPATYDAQLAAVKTAQSIDGVRAVDNDMQLAVSQADLKTAA